MAWQEVAGWLAGQSAAPTPANGGRRITRRTDPALLDTAARWLEGGGG